jgi:Type II secretion system (T2SS), protein M subtype b
MITELLQLLKPRMGVLALLTAGLLLGGYSYGLNVWRLAGYQRIEEKLAYYDRMRSIAAFRLELAMVPADKAFGDAFLGSGTPAMLSAEMAAKLKNMAAADGIQVMQQTELAPKTEDSLQLAGVNIQIVGSWPALVAFIAEVEGARPFIMIDRIAIRPGILGNPNEAADVPVQVDMDLRGAIQTPAEKMAASQSP